MQIKGAVLLARKEFAEEHFGKEGWKEILDYLPVEDEIWLKSVIQKDEWYPFEMGKRLDDAIVRILGQGDENIFREIGKKSAQINLTTVHHALLTPGDPQKFMSKTGTIYKMYYDVGYREYEPTGPDSGVMTTYQAETYSVPDCLTVMGWYKEALHMCGAKSVEIKEEECRARGGEFCRYRLNWQM